MDYTKLSLNGEWQIQPGEEKPTRWEYTVAVPGLVDNALPALDWQSHDYFWYRKMFRLPPGVQHSKIYLQMEQVQFGTEVWLNGKLVGGDIPCYTSQEFDLSPYVNASSENELIVRVGAKHTLPPESAVGNDFEKLSFIPGIWGDVWLHIYGAARFRWTQIIPNVENQTVRIHSEIELLEDKAMMFDVVYRVEEKKSGRAVSAERRETARLEPGKVKNLDLEIHIPDARLWSPEDPFLYALEARVESSGEIAHRCQIAFGMRTFEIRGGDFFLNGRRRVLMGSNIAFHRMLSDSTRGNLPWQKQWIKKVLVDIPKQHNMFFFRFHLGHAYNRWYDIADENGILLQDEWMFWPPSGTPEQIRKEFSAWIRENCNHPSIVIWDALNESTDSVITGQIIPELKQLDPTRPWELADFEEDHPYIYSLGPVLNGKKFGYSRSIFDLEKSPTPTMVNEYIWWWLDRNGVPTSLTKLVVNRWLGPHASREQLLEHQAFLATELTELWRRLDLDAIMPFVYLSVGEGPTANWFFGPLSELKPKPILAALKNAFSPVGVSIELWDRHFLTGECREISVYVFNDSLRDEVIQLKVYMEDQKAEIPVFLKRFLLKTGEHAIIPVATEFPESEGESVLIAEVSDPARIPVAFSQKPVITFSPVTIPQKARDLRLMVHDISLELTRFLDKRSFPYVNFPQNLEQVDVCLINGNSLNSTYFQNLEQLTKFVQSGGVLIVQEPEIAVSGEEQKNILKDLEINIQYREDPERGGYDSYVIPVQSDHFLWKGILPKYLRLFNGALGGEIVSQHNVRPSVPFHSIANCNLSLKVPAVMEIPYGRGWVIISRIQIRGRLLRSSAETNLYDRRYDPVAELYFWNLVSGYVNQEDYHHQIEERLSRVPIYVANIRTSSGQIYDAIDGNMNTRWSSKAADPQWLWIDFGRVTSLKKLTIQWEVAYGKEYAISASNDNRTWREVFVEENSDGGKDEIVFENLETRYLRIDFKKRGTQWGYSIWEMHFE